jgi:UDP-glucose 4-epimerase
MSVIMVTGGAGFIGSHTCVELLQAGHDVVVVDNLSNSSQEALRRVEKLTGRQVAFHRVEMLEEAALLDVFRRHKVDAVIHFAALKAVGESVGQPLRYFRNNLGSTLNLLQCMKTVGVRRLVFSSSCTVYGNPSRVPVTEDFPRSATNPYGRTKLMLEEILEDLCVGEPGWQVVLLRYFNPVGAHASGTMGEDPRGIPNNLMPFIMKVAVGKLPQLSVFGQDYPTPDGTGVRDYIHVVDLARGHLAALQGMEAIKGCVAVNLGTGQGYSVLDVVKAAEAATGRKIPLLMAPRRAGDIAATYADPSRAKQLLGWSATRSLAEMCADSWRWQQANPNGYGE